MKKRIFWGICTLLVMGLIFYFSSQNGEVSAMQSGWFSSLLAALFPGLEDVSSFLVRKAAHFSIYALLGFCALHFLSTFPSLPPARVFWLSWMVCFLYAASDEYHQTFTAMRAGQISDVLLDTCGALAGIIVGKCLFQFGRYRHKNR